MIGELVAMRADIEGLKSAFGHALKVGPVEQIDAAKGYRVKLGEGPDGPYLSPWYPHPESGGANSTWIPLSQGQVVGVLCPNGDPRQGILVRGGFSGVHPPISTDTDEVRLQMVGVTISVKGGAVSISADGPVTVDAPEVNLGGEGGKPVARVGDTVEIGSGSSAGAWPIVKGSDVVKAV